MLPLAVQLPEAGPVARLLVARLLVAGLNVDRYFLLNNYVAVVVVGATTAAWCFG